jgi:RNA polymerase sigma factor (sigma-70 family)
VEDKTGQIMQLLDEALTRLTFFDERQATFLEMSFIARQTFDEIAQQLGVSTRTVKRDWTMVRTWLPDQFATLK